MQVTHLDDTGDRSVNVSITPAGLEPLDLELAVVDGHCVPLRIAAEWRRLSEAAVAFASMLRPGSVQERAKVAAGLAEAERQLARINDTPREERFAKVLEELRGLDGLMRAKLAEAKADLARAHLRMIDSMLTHHAIMQGDYPRSLDELSEAVPLDPWGNRYHYRAPDEDTFEYQIVCYGADGKPGGQGPDADIVHAR